MRRSTRSAPTSRSSSGPSTSRAVDAIVLPGRRVDDDRQAARLVGPARAAARRARATACPRSATCAGLIVLAREVVDGRPDQQPLGVHRRHRAPQRLRPPARLVRGRRSTVARARRRPVPRRVHPRAAWSSGSAPASRCSPSTTASRCSAARARVWFATLPSRARRATSGCTSCSSSEVSVMSGHSKWHSIKHKKGAADAARGKLFAVLIRQIEVAARAGGGDPDVERDAAHDGAEGARHLGADGHDPARDQARHRRGRRRHLRVDHLRGLRARAASR